MLNKVSKLLKSASLSVVCMSMLVCVGTLQAQPGPLLPKGPLLPNMEEFNKATSTENTPGPLLP